MSGDGCRVSGDALCDTRHPSPDTLHRTYLRKIRVWLLYAAGEGDANARLPNKLLARHASGGGKPRVDGNALILMKAFPST